MASSAAGTPEKLPRKTALYDQVMTPEKPEQRPTARGSNVAFSVNGVRRALLGMRRPEEGSADAAVVKEDGLESLEKEFGVGTGAGRSSGKRKPEVKLPESYEMLSEFFNCLESSTRLLRLKGSKATFPNICASIQHLSERRFTYSHLAQLKYIMPESIVINKILLRDETTCCMKPDLQVNLLVDAVETTAKQKGETVYSALRRIFRQRLVDFFRDHPEGDDIPEHELPHPFNRTRLSESKPVPRIVPESISPVESSQFNGQPAVLSHMPQSFKRRFSRGSPISSATASTTSPVAKIESTIPSPLSRNSLVSSDASGSLCIDTTSNDKNGQPDVMSHTSQSFKRRFSRGSPISSSTASTTSPVAKVESTIPSPLISRDASGTLCIDATSNANKGQVVGKDEKDAVSNYVVSEGTPAKLVSTPVRLMASTPALKTPKRPISATGDDTSPMKIVKRSARAKLFTTPTKSASSVDGANLSESMSAIDSDDELLNFLPQSLLQSVKAKEQRALEEKETGFADQLKRQKLIASLPNTFDVIFLIYQSRQRSVMTKQELIHKIIASSPKIVDRSEVEEQLTLLEEFVPDWIFEKTGRSGDVLCCVDTTLSQAELRQRLYAAK